MSTIYDFTATTADGESFPLSQYEGKPVLVVNVASKCGYTKQYAGLESLYEELRGRGLEIIGFPCDQFGNQEPGTDAEIQEFCSMTYGVTFPVMAKIEVNGPDAAPLYQYLRAADPGDFHDNGGSLYSWVEAVNPATIGTDEVKWNFTKFLVGADGHVIRRYETYVKPEEIRGDLEALLD